MARSIAFTVTTAAQQLIDGAAGSAGVPASATIQNPTGSGGTVYVGGSDVSTANGLQILEGASFSIDLVGEDVYIIAASSVSVRVFLSRA